MFELTVERQFAAAHHLRGYAGACARLHGHNYKVLASFRGESLDEAGFLLDFGVLKRLCDEVLAPLDHQCLNELAAFTESNPTAEALARYLYRELEQAAAGLPARVASVTVFESDTAAVTYRED